MLLTVTILALPPNDPTSFSETTFWGWVSESEKCSFGFTASSQNRHLSMQTYLIYSALTNLHSSSKIYIKTLAS